MTTYYNVFLNLLKKHKLELVTLLASYKITPTLYPVKDLRMLVCKNPTTRSDIDFPLVYY